MISSRENCEIDDDAIGPPYARLDEELKRPAANDGAAALMTEIIEVVHCHYLRAPCRKRPDVS